MTRGRSLEAREHFVGDVLPPPRFVGPEAYCVRAYRHRAVKKAVRGRMLARVPVAQKVVAEPSVRAAASPPKTEPVSLQAVLNTSATVAAAVTAEKRLVRQAGVAPRGSRVKSQPSIV
jgi:hypothetical protein